MQASKSQKNHSETLAPKKSIIYSSEYHFKKTNLTKVLLLSISIECKVNLCLCKFEYSPHCFWMEYKLKLGKMIFKSSNTQSQNTLTLSCFPPPPYLASELKKSNSAITTTFPRNKNNMLSHKNWHQFKSTFLKTHASCFEKKSLFQTDIILQISVASRRIVASFFWRVVKVGC